MSVERRRRRIAILQMLLLVVGLTLSGCAGDRHVHYDSSAPLERIGARVQDSAQLADCGVWNELHLGETEVVIGVPACWYVATSPSELALMSSVRSEGGWLLVYLRVFDAVSTSGKLIAQSGGEGFDGVAAPGWKDNEAINRAACHLRAWIVDPNHVEGQSPSDPDQLAMALQGLKGVDEPVITEHSEVYGEAEWSITRLVAARRESDYSSVLYAFIGTTPCKEGLLVLALCGRSGPTKLDDVFGEILVRSRVGAVGCGS